MNKASAITTALTALLTLNLGLRQVPPTRRSGLASSRPRQARTPRSAKVGLFGAEAAIEDINKQGGVMVGNTRMLLKLVAVDDESDPAKTASLAEKLISSEKVPFHRQRGTSLPSCTAASPR